MKITFIAHSGFFIEWETCCWLFDYYQGEIPEMNPDKKLFVFASHKHEDHYNPEIFKLYNQYKDIHYVLSSDIRPMKGISQFTEESLEKISGRILLVKPLNQYELYDKNKEKIHIRALKSTDCGVAFLVQYQGKTIYHAGDLNLWVWDRNTKQVNNNMTAMFNREMNSLKDIPIDIAFVPLDPRLEESYYKGLEGLLKTTEVRYVFPMHLWEKFSLIPQFKAERATYIKETQIMEINRNGQEWEL